MNQYFCVLKIKLLQKLTYIMKQDTKIYCLHFFISWNKHFVEYYEAFISVIITRRNQHVTSCGNIGCPSIFTQMNE